MIRTLISISEEDKKWLEDQAAEEGISMAELVRRAVRRMREEVSQMHLRRRIFSHERRVYGQPKTVLITSGGCVTSGESHGPFYAAGQLNGLSTDLRVLARP